MNAYSQTGDSTISMVGRKWMQNGQYKTNNEIISVISRNPLSISEFKKYRSAYTAKVTLMTIGCAAIVGGGITYLVNRENNGLIGLGIGAGGLGLFIIGIIPGWSANAHLTNAIDNYNRSLKTAYISPIKLNFVVNYNCLGVNLSF